MLFCRPISVIFKQKMPTRESIAGINARTFIPGSLIILLINCQACNADHQNRKKNQNIPDPGNSEITNGKYNSANMLLVLPGNPAPGEPFRILATGDENIRKAQIIINGSSGNLRPTKSETGNELPFWRIDDFPGSTSGKYNAELVVNNNKVSNLDFNIETRKPAKPDGRVWKTLNGWDSRMETLYSALINALFHGLDEQVTWSALHEVTRNPKQNFLYDYLSLNEDDPENQYTVIMQPDCADNPFFLRAYFSWKMGLPFGYHICDRGYVGHNPRPGQWCTNDYISSQKVPVAAFNNFLRKMRDGVQSATARTALDDEKSDYYALPLERSALRPGTVYADPYGHTLMLVSWIPQTSDRPGMLLAIDAQPDGTVGIKRFWKGNFLFNTSGVVGEPGFKAFRPISVNNGIAHLMKNEELTKAAGFIPFSLRQRKMNTDLFYHTMERIINPEPLYAESALTDLIQALYEQLLVRVTSVANGEAYFKSHPGAIIPMPSNANGIFLAGGQWEDFSTPNRDLRLLIAMDAVLDFPELASRSPEDYKFAHKLTSEQLRTKLQTILEQKVPELSISYTRSDGSIKTLTVGEILKRKDAFEMAYNPNDGIEIRWGAPEKSSEISTCRRHAPAYQSERMRAVRMWFSKRLHPPT